MTTKLIVSTAKAAPAAGPYSQATRTEQFVFASGQLPIDPVSGKRSREGLRAIRPLALRRSKCSEVTLFHRCCRHVTEIEGGIRALDRRLVAAKEKQFVLDDRPAQHAAKLVTFERVAFGGEEVARVQCAVA